MYYNLLSILFTRFIVNIKEEIFPFPWFLELHLPIKKEKPVLEITVHHWTLSDQIWIMITHNVQTFIEHILPFFFEVIVHP